MCFSNGIKEKEGPKVSVYDLSKMQAEEIKDRLRMELNLVDKHSLRAEAIL